MDSQIVAVYCLCDDMLKAVHHEQDPQCQMTDAEVMTTALVAALFFGGNQEQARKLLHEQGYIPQMLSRSRFNRRWHRLADRLWALVHLLGEHWKALNSRSTYIIDSFPVAVCDNYRIARCKLYHGEAWRGYQASKKRYFYGLKIHLLITADGQPVEFFFTPGAASDTAALRMYRFDLPAGTRVTGDKAFTDYEYEDLLQQAGIDFVPLRKKNSLRPLPPWMTYLMACYRKMVETTGSRIERLLPKHIHAVTAHGFELKLALFVLACSFTFA